MGMDLHGNGWYKAAGWTTWRTLFEAAVDYGWKPAGTVMFLPSIEELVRRGEVGLPPETLDGLVPDPIWEGGYFTNDLQLVTMTDAQQFADGLTKAAQAGAVQPAFVEPYVRRFYQSYFIIM